MDESNWYWNQTENHLFRKSDKIDQLKFRIYLNSAGFMDGRDLPLHQASTWVPYILWI